MQLAEDRRKAEEAKSKQREMHDLLTFVQGQIHGEGTTVFWYQCVPWRESGAALHSRPASNEVSIFNLFEKRQNKI